MSLSADFSKFNVTDIDDVKIEIGSIVRIDESSHKIIDSTYTWDSALLRLFKFEFRKVNVHELTLQMLSNIMKLIEHCNENIRKSIKEFGSFHELNVGSEISCVSPITSLVTGLELSTIEELCEVPRIIVNQLHYVLKKISYYDMASLIHALLHISSLTLSLLEVQYLLEMCTKGCIQEGDICATHPLLTDTAVRSIGVDIVSGSIPGIVVMTCTTKRIDVNSVLKVISELAQRNFLIIVTGLLARILETYPIEGEQTIFDIFQDRVIKCIPLLGSLHYVGVLIRAAELFAGKKIQGNFVDIANYIFTKVGAVTLIWGPISVDLLPLILGLCRLGIPVIIHPEAPLLISGKLDEKWFMQDTRSEKIVEVEHVPPNLLSESYTIEDILLGIVQSCMRLCDNSKCRLAKLCHYIDLHVKLRGKLPDNLHELIRTESEIPLSAREEIMKMLHEKSWREREVFTDLKLVIHKVR